MFTALSDFLLKKNGIIYGVAFDNEMRVCHTRAENIAESDRFKGSKYVQSDLNGIFKQIKRDILDKRDVLSSGTPCQIAVLKKFLNTQITID